MQDGLYKYSNTNNNCFINNHLSSTEDVFEQAETYNLNGAMKKNHESALEIMFNSKFISVGGENIAREIVRRRLENISYEHIVYVDNNMPREMVNGKNCEELIENKVMDRVEKAIKNSENRTARLMFKQTVEVAKIFWLLVKELDIDYENVDELHNDCVREVKSINGAIGYPIIKSKD